MRTPVRLASWIGYGSVRRDRPDSEAPRLYAQRPGSKKPVTARVKTRRSHHILRAISASALDLRRLRLAFLSPLSGRWLAMIQAYIDESGTHDQAKIIVGAGFLSSYKRWRKFEKQWSSVLNPVGGDRLVFHATDCLGKDGYGDFAGQSKDDRNRLVDKLIPIARQKTLFCFSAAFARSDYEAVVPESMKRKWKHPYFLCMFHIANLIQVNRPKFPFPPSEKVAFVFARNPGFVGLLGDLYDQLKHTAAVGDILGKMTIGTPEEDIPLQAADLICYLTRTFWEKEHFHEGSAHPRTHQLLRELVRRKEFTLEPHFLSRKALEEFVRIFKETQAEAGEWEWNR